MPWEASEATRFTKRARGGKAKRQWSAVADSALKRGASEGAAVRMANAVVKRRAGRGKR